MRKLVALIAAVALLTTAVVAYAGTTSVSWKVGSNKTLRIKRGSSVKWVWTDSQPHNVKGPGLATRAVTKRGFAVSRKFTKKGTFTYICQVHRSMKTVVKVS